MALTITRHTKFRVLVLFLVVSIASSRAIPFYEPWGIDLNNILVYQQCATEVSPYLTGAKVCGDLHDRQMLYPPLLYHSFAWLRVFSQAVAIRLWSVVIVLGLAASLWCWARLGDSRSSWKRPWREWVFVTLLLYQYPVLFSIERGGSDVIPVLLFTLGAVFLMRQRFNLGGAALGAATAYKLYPAFATAVVIGGLFLVWAVRPWARLRAWLPCGSAALASFLGLNLVFFNDASLYYGTVLPGFANTMTLPAEYSHAVPSFVGPNFHGFSWLLMGGLTALWVAATRRCILEGNPAIAFAGALSIATYMQGTSYDYNLITVYPLLLLVFQRAWQSNRWGLLALGLVSIVGDRQVFALPGVLLTPYTHVALQLAFYTLLAMDLTFRGTGGDPEFAPLAPQRDPATPHGASARS